MLTTAEAVVWCGRMSAVVRFEPHGGVRLLVAEHTIWKHKGEPRSRSALQAGHLNLHERRDEGPVSIEAKGAYTDITAATFEGAVESAIGFWIEQIGLVDALALLASEEI